MASSCSLFFDWNKKPTRPLPLTTSERTTKMFNGTYTIENTKTGEHRTFSIKTQKPDAKFAPGSRVLALLNGPDNTADYQGFAFITAQAPGVTVWKSKCGSFVGGTYKHSAFEVYATMLVTLVEDAEKGKLKGNVWHQRGYKVHLEGSCIYCNRKLTTPESIKCGIGPDCAEKHGIDRASLAAAFDLAARHAESCIPGGKAEAKVVKPAPLPLKAKVTPEATDCDDTAYFRQKAREEQREKEKGWKRPANLWDACEHLSPEESADLARAEADKKTQLAEAAKASRPGAGPKVEGREKCSNCGGSGIYRWGACVNGVMSKSGPCFRCEGKGYQDEADRRRNYGYDNHRPIGGVSVPTTDDGDDDREFDKEIQRRDREDSERAARAKLERDVRANFRRNSNEN